MNYNTEVINQMAQQLAEMFKSVVTAQQESDGSIATIAQIESDMREALWQIGNQALGLFLSSMQTTPEKEIVCSCGGTLHYQRMREAMVISVFGKTIYVRAYYAGCRCKEGKAPLDKQCGLEPGAVTAGFAARRHSHGFPNGDGVADKHTDRGSCQHQYAHADWHASDFCVFIPAEWDSRPRYDARQHLPNHELGNTNRDGRR